MQNGGAVAGVVQFDFAWCFALYQQQQPSTTGQQQRQAIAIIEQALGGQALGGAQQFGVHVHTSLNTSSKRFSASSMISSLSAALVYMRLPARVTRPWAM